MLSHSFFFTSKNHPSVSSKLVRSKSFCQTHPEDCIEYMTRVVHEVKHSPSSRAVNPSDRRRRRRRRRRRSALLRLYFCYSHPKPRLEARDGKVPATQRAIRFSSVLKVSAALRKKLNVVCWLLRTSRPFNFHLLSTCVTYY